MLLSVSVPISEPNIHISLPTYLLINLPIYHPIFLPTCPTTYIPTNQPIYQPPYPPTNLPTH